MKNGQKGKNQPAIMLGQIIALCVLCFFPSAASADTIVWTNSAGGNWSVASNWSPNEVPGSSDDAYITTAGVYTVTLDIFASVNSLTLGGTSGQQTLDTAQNVLGLDGSSIVNSNGVLRLTYATTYNESWLTISAGGVLDIGGELDLFGPLTNSGTVNWQAGNVTVYYQPDNGQFGEIWNGPGGLWDCQTNSSIWPAYGPEQFYNLGTLRKSAGGGTTSIGVYLSNNGGTVDAQNGTLSLDGGFSLYGGTLNFGISSLTNFGQVYLSGFPVWLDGTLSASLNGGFVPAVGNSFAVLQFSAQAGSFTNFNLPSSVIWQTNYDSTDFTLTALNIRPTPMPSSMRGTVVAWGDNTYHQTNVPAGLFATTIAAGYWHNLAVTLARKVTAWGLNDYGQTSVPAGLSNVVAVAAGHDHSLALRTNGVVVGWGDDTYGQIDMPPDLTNSAASVVEIAAGAFHSAALKSDGTVECWGYDFYGETDPPADLTNAIAIACGNAFSLALRTDGTVAGWGDDFYGQIDTPADLTNVVAIAAGGFHGIALKADGTVECWGYDFYGQAEVPVDLTNATSVGAGYFHSLAVKPDGSEEQWGDTSLGQTLGSTNINKPNRFLETAGGYGGSIALKDARIIITNQPVDVTTNVGSVVKFAVGVTGATPLSYRWWFNNAIVSSALNLVLPTNTLTLNNVTTNSAGPYFVTISNAVGIVTSSVANLFVYSSDSPTIVTNPANQTISVGGNATFSVAAIGATPFYYQWYFIQTNNVGFGNFLATNAIPDATDVSYTVNNAQATNAGRYFVVVTNTAGSATSSNATLSVLLPPAVTSQPVDVTTNVGAVVKFSVAVTGSTPLTYRWWFSNSIISTTLNTPALGNTVTLNNVGPGNAGPYLVTISNIVGVVTSSVANLFVYSVDSPTIITSPTNQTVNAGSNATFSVFAIGLEPFYYQWYFIQTNINIGFTNLTTNAIPDATDIFYTVINAQATNAGRYFVVVTNSAGSATSSNATLTVRLPPTVTSQPVDVTTNVAAVAKFAVGVTGTTPLTYRWWFSNSVVSTFLNSGSLSNTLTLNNVTTNIAGPYFVTVSNIAGIATSSVANLTTFFSQSLTPAQLWLLYHSGTSGDALMIALEAGKNYRIQSTTNLQTWSDITNFLSGSTLMDYTNSLSTNANSMFYRIVSP